MVTRRVRKGQRSGKKKWSYKTCQARKHKKRTCSRPAHLLKEDTKTRRVTTERQREETVEAARGSIAAGKERRDWVRTWHSSLGFSHNLDPSSSNGSVSFPLFCLSFPFFFFSFTFPSLFFYFSFQHLALVQDGAQSRFTALDFRLFVCLS